MSQRAVSRILSAFARLAASVGVTTIPLVPSSLTGSSDLPGDSADGPSAPGSRGPDPLATLFGLAPCGVLPATRVATGAVRSYRTFSPLLAYAGPFRPATAKQAVRPAA